MTHPKAHPTQSHCARLCGGPERASSLRWCKLQRVGPGCGPQLCKYKLHRGTPGAILRSAALAPRSPPGRSLLLTAPRSPSLRRLSPAKRRPRWRARVVKRLLCCCNAKVVKRCASPHPGRVGNTTKFDPARQRAGACRAAGSPGVQQRVPAHSDRTGQPPKAAAGKSRAETLVQTPGRSAPTLPPPARSPSFAFFPDRAARKGRQVKTHPAGPPTFSKKQGTFFPPASYHHQKRKVQPPCCLSSPPRPKAP